MRIKFHITPVYPYGDDHYYHEIIALAEGFKNLGHVIYGNANYWWNTKEQSFLIEESKSKDFDIAIYDYRYARSFEHLLFRKGYPNFDKTKKHVLIDRNDWISPFWLNNKHYEIYDVICAGNLYKNYKKKKNVRPWTIGFTNRIAKYIDKTISTNEIELISGYNFRVKHNMRGFLLQNIKNKQLKYPLKECFTDSIQQTDIDLLEEDKSLWIQSTKRHNPAYYDILNKSLLFLAFGGYYEMKPFMYQPYSYLDKVKRKYHYWKYKQKKSNNVDFSDDIFIFQHDNFRFWEVMYSSSVAINLDLDFWGFWLPEMPVNGKHYLGIKKLDANNLTKKINSLTKEELQLIGTQGREWVKTHYSPNATAKRILNYLNLK